MSNYKKLNPQKKLVMYFQSRLNFFFDAYKTKKGTFHCGIKSTGSDVPRNIPILGIKSRFKDSSSKFLRVVNENENENENEKKIVLNVIETDKNFIKLQIPIVFLSRPHCFKNILNHQKGRLDFKLELKLFDNNNNNNNNNEQCILKGDCMAYFSDPIGVRSRRRRIIKKRKYNNEDELNGQDSNDEENEDNNNNNNNNVNYNNNNNINVNAEGGRKKIKRRKKEDLEREIVTGSKLWNVFKSGEFDGCLSKICEQFDVDSANNTVCKEKMIEELMRKIFHD